MSLNDENPTKGCKTFEEFLARNKGEISRDQCEALWAYYRKEEIRRNTHSITKQPEVKKNDSPVVTKGAATPHDQWPLLNLIGVARKHWLIVATLVIVGLVSNEYDNASKQAADRQKAQQLEVMRQRISTSDPLTNLAGCMTNNATYLAKIQIAGVIFSSDKSERLSNEEVDAYLLARNALVESCREFAQGLQNVTHQQLNGALFSVMRRDPTVRSHYETLNFAHEAVKEAYVSRPERK